MSTKSSGPILITGAGTGIGRLYTDTFAQRGHEVYACVYRNSEVSELNQLKNVSSLQVDITKTSDIQNMVKWIEEKNNSLYGLINNAGVADLWPLYESTTDDIYRVFNVNVMGAFNVTKALLPFLIKSKGRIVNIGSVAGTVAGAFYGAYSISKYGMEAFSEVLKREVRKFGIHVSLIKPGFFKSDITKHIMPIFDARKGKFDNSIYNQEINSLFDQMNNSNVVDGSQYPTPERVVEGVYDALFSANPKGKYLIVSNKKEYKVVIDWVLKYLVELNSHNEFSYSHKELHDLLDTFLNR